MPHKDEKPQFKWHSWVIGTLLTLTPLLSAVWIINLKEPAPKHLPSGKAINASSVIWEENLPANHHWFVIKEKIAQTEAQLTAIDESWSAQLNSAPIDQYNLQDDEESWWYSHYQSEATNPIEIFYSPSSPSEDSASEETTPETAEYLFACSNIITPLINELTEYCKKTGSEFIPLSRDGYIKYETTEAIINFSVRCRLNALLALESNNNDYFLDQIKNLSQLLNTMKKVGGLFPYEINNDLATQHYNLCLLAINSGVLQTHHLEGIQNSLNALNDNDDLTLNYLRHSLSAELAFFSQFDSMPSLYDYLGAKAPAGIYELPQSESIEEFKNIIKHAYQKNLNHFVRYKQEPQALIKWLNEINTDKYALESLKDIHKQEYPHTYTLMQQDYGLPYSAATISHIYASTFHQLIQEALHQQNPNLFPAGIDPFDGKPIRSRLNNDGTTTLWSIGVDQKDNGGNDRTPFNQSLIRPFTGAFVTKFGEEKDPDYPEELKDYRISINTTSLNPNAN